MANRVEEALAAAVRSGRVELPLFELVADTERGEVRLSSLEWPHRYADAYGRDSLLGGDRFDVSKVGKALRSASGEDVRPLYEREPYSLLYGAWDSHRKGRQAKFARLYSSEMYGLNPEGKRLPPRQTKDEQGNLVPRPDPSTWELDPSGGTRSAGRYDPMNLSGAIDSKDHAESDWAFIPEGEKKKGGRLSEIGHGHIAPNPAHGGVTVSSIHRRAWVSMAGLERLRFGDAPFEATVLARATLAALALMGDRLAFGKASLWLRSGCDLTKVSERVGFEVAGGGIEEIEVSAAEAIAAFEELRDRTDAAGLVMARDVLPLVPIPGLAKAIAFAVTKSAPDSGE